jgi:hypothetical protein
MGSAKERQAHDAARYHLSSSTTPCENSPAIAKKISGQQPQVLPLLPLLLTIKLAFPAWNPDVLVSRTKGRLGVWNTETVSQNAKRKPCWLVLLSSLANSAENISYVKFKIYSHIVEADM